MRHAVARVNVGSLIRIMRKERLSKNRLAEKIGCSRSWVSAITSPTKNAGISIEMVDRLINAFEEKYSPDEIVSWL